MNNLKNIALLQIFYSHGKNEYLWIEYNNKQTSCFYAFKNKWEIRLDHLITFVDLLSYFRTNTKKNRMSVERSFTCL